jgi:hypothetical protein
LGVISGVVAAQGIAHSDFVTFCIGTALAGFYAACVQSYRFAATDLVSEPAQQAKAISRVMIGGLIAAIIGPQVVIWTRDALPATPFAGSFYSQAAWPCWPCPAHGPASAAASEQKPWLTTPGRWAKLPARPSSSWPARPVWSATD